MPQWWVFLAAVLTRLLFAPIARLWVRRGARKEVEAEIVKEDVLKQESARVAVHKEKRDADGLSDSDLADRLRRRSDDWTRL